MRLRTSFRQQGFMDFFGKTRKAEAPSKCASAFLCAVIEFDQALVAFVGAELALR